VLVLATLELFVILAVRWALRMLVRSGGLLSLLLGFFLVTIAQWLLVRTASSTSAS
jgi:hypothetical protein